MRTVFFYIVLLTSLLIKSNFTFSQSECSSSIDEEHYDEEESQGEDDDEDNNCSRPTLETLNNTDFTACQYCHFLSIDDTRCPAQTAEKCKTCPLQGTLSRFGVRSSPIYRLLLFKLKFNDNAKYGIQGVDKNQNLVYDGNGDPIYNNWWNKIMQINSRECSRHKYYLSLGWQWDLQTNKMDLALYSHIDHRTDKCAFNACCNDGVDGREYILLGKSVDVNEEISTEMIFYSKGFYVRAGERGVAIRRDFTREGLNEDKKTRIRKYGFFGGNNCPDFKRSNMIDVENIVVDFVPFWWTVTSYKGYGRSVFYSGESQTIYASDMVEMSVCVQSTSSPRKGRYTLFESGSNIILAAGNEINFYEGAEAEVGSTVEGYISSTAVTNTGEVFEYTCPSGSGKNAYENTQQEDMNSSADYNDAIYFYPNPFHNNTQVFYSIRSTSTVTLTIHNVFGQEVSRLLNEQIQGRGTYSLTFDASSLPAGVYFCTFSAQSEKGETFKEVKKLVKLK